MLFSASAQAQIHRCESSDGQISYQDVACPEQAPEQAPAPVADAASMEVSYMEPPSYVDPPSYLPGGWTRQQRRARRHEAKMESRQEAARTRILLQPASDRRAAQYAEASHRCQVAKRVAALCGTDAAFTCTSKGFRSEPVAEADAPARPEIVDHASAFSRSQCALQATRGRY